MVADRLSEPLNVAHRLPRAAVLPVDPELYALVVEYMGFQHVNCSKGDMPFLPHEKFLSSTERVGDSFTHIVTAHLSTSRPEHPNDHRENGADVLCTVKLAADPTNTRDRSPRLVPRS